MSKNKSMTDDELFEIARKFIRRSDLKKYNNKAYQALHRRGLLELACIHMQPSVTEAYTYEELWAEAKKYSNKTDFRKASRSMYDVAYKRGILSGVCSHMPQNMCLLIGENNPKTKWTLSILQNRAKIFNRKIDFYNNDPQAYAAAYINGFLEEICEHMEESYHTWTDEEIFKASKLCYNRSEFQKKFSRAYQAARERGEDFLNEVCGHMPLSHGTSHMEKEIFSIIKKHFPTTKKFRIQKINIEGKPHIQGFEIDIFIPELNLGIEFDGTYYHSFSGLKRSRTNWPDEDILNYHQIKDGYFASKGIPILHIKEEDWIKDKESCIQKCLEFLEVKKEKAA